MPSCKSRIVKVATFFCATVLVGCKPPAASSGHAGLTGVCFSHLSALAEGGVVSFHQIILVRSSGNLSKDIRRINGLSADRFLFRNPHTIPNTWLSAWLDDERADATRGPDCSSLPMAKL